MAQWLQLAKTDAAGAPPTMTLTLHIQPGAKKSEVAGLYGDALKIRLAAPPVDGRANEALIAFLAQRLGLPKSALTLKSGQSSRRKRIEVNAAPDDAEQRLLGACGGAVG
jgi:uncharacterized protein (TIGR00251 family)